ncbi:ubiquitin-conjugating enzyme E2 D2-like [Aduncisulcus paluster]|uniref:Ubiquitin-conjugating enzyme E2 D2-like n=1 Tax=Aduncisulcus paluster TaxID=2918883 RepID=A0ABQ5KLM7_9EUKA|nr:ubiquitin-conjugating enzyme E2 D2-like [Aduncisulcus paluster]
MAKRIEHELKKLKTELPPGYEAHVVDDDLFKWQATIIGAAGTPYEGGRFKLLIDLPTDYPFRPPKVVFETRVFHPNIRESGEICLDILRPKEWAPCLNISKVLISICSLLTDPNPADPLNTEAAELMQKDKKKYEEKVREYVESYATK